MKTRLLFLNQCFDKTRLRNLIAWVLFTKGEKETIEIVEKLKGLGFQFATRAGISLSIDDLKIPSEKVPLVSQAKQQVALATSQYEKGNVTSIEKLQQLVDTWHRTSETLKQTVVSNFQATDKLSPVYMMAFSGARGNISQVRQLAGMRGLMADPQGQIIGFPIRSNFREGLTLTEYMISCYGARKGLVDTALRTADAGYLTRRLVDVSQHMVVKASTCATRRGIVLYELAISGKSALSLRDRLVGRVLAQDVYLRGSGEPKESDRERQETVHSPRLLGSGPPHMAKVGERNQEISANLASQIASVQKRVSVRSPLTCSIRHGVCQLCYGWSLSEGRLVNLGEAVGIIAAQSIGEPGTQLTMRTFHTGGVFSGDVMTEIRAPYEGTAHFSNPLQGLLIRTSHGKIAFLTKSSGKVAIQANLKSYRPKDIISSSNDNIIKDEPKLEETLFALEASTVVFVRQHEKVLQTQLIAEFSSMGTEINETIEAKRTLFANNAGQISFASLLIARRIRENGDIVRKSRDLGFVWILSGKQPGPVALLDLFQRGTHIVNQNTIVAKALCVETSSKKEVLEGPLGFGSPQRTQNETAFVTWKSPVKIVLLGGKTTRVSVTGFEALVAAKAVRKFLPSILYSWIRLKSFTGNKSHLQHTTEGWNQSLSSIGRGNGNANCQQVVPVLFRPISLAGINPVLGSPVREAKPPQLSTSSTFNQSALCKQPYLSYSPLHNRAFVTSDNTSVWIFPSQYQTPRNGLAWFDSRYLSQRLNLGEVIWIETEAASLHRSNPVATVSARTTSRITAVNPLAGQPSLDKPNVENHPLKGTLLQKVRKAAEAERHETNYLNQTPVSSLRRGEAEYLVTSTHFPNLFAKEGQVSLGTPSSLMKAGGSMATPSSISLMKGQRRGGQRGGYLVNKKAQQQTVVDTSARLAHSRHQYKKATATKSWVVTFEKGQNFSKEKALNLQKDYFFRELLINKRVTMPHRAEDHFFLFKDVGAHKKMSEGNTEQIDRQSYRWIYCPQHIQKLSTLHESINFYRNRQFDKLSFDSSLVYIKTWFNLELLYSIKNNLDCIASKLFLFSERNTTFRQASHVTSQTLQREMNHWRPRFLSADFTISTSAFQFKSHSFWASVSTTRQYSSLYHNLIELPGNKPLDKSNQARRLSSPNTPYIVSQCNNRFLLHFAGAASLDVAPDKNGLRSLRGALGWGPLNEDIRPFAKGRALDLGFRSRLKSLDEQRMRGFDGHSQASRGFVKKEGLLFLRKLMQVPQGYALHERAISFDKWGEALSLAEVLQTERKGPNSVDFIESGTPFNPRIVKISVLPDLKKLSFDARNCFHLPQYNELVEGFDGHPFVGQGWPTNPFIINTIDEGQGWPTKGWPSKPLTQGVLKIRLNTLETLNLQETGKTERYKFLVWKNLMNCKPFMLLRTCSLQVQVVSNLKARYFLPLSVEHPLTWHSLVYSLDLLRENLGTKVWRKAESSTRLPVVSELGAVQNNLEARRRQKGFLHQLGLRQQIALGPLPLETDRRDSFFDSLTRQGIEGQPQVDDRSSGVWETPPPSTDSSFWVQGPSRSRMNVQSCGDVNKRIAKVQQKRVSWPYSPQATLLTVMSKGSFIPLPSRTKLTLNYTTQSDAEGTGALPRTGFANVLQHKIDEKNREAVAPTWLNSRNLGFRFGAKIRRTPLIINHKPNHLSLASLLLTSNFCTKVVSNNSYLIRFLGTINLPSANRGSRDVTRNEERLSPAMGELVSQDSLRDGRYLGMSTSLSKSSNTKGLPSNTVLLSESDQISMSLSKQKTNVSVGQFVTLGEEFVSKHAALVSGQVVAIEQDKVTLRRTQALLFYAQGVTHVNHGQWVNKNAPILTLTYQKLVTGDIVQGIPKIEQFFEAPATRDGEPLSNSLQSRLRKTYNRLKTSLPHVQAVKHSLEEIQQVLVEGILRVYLSQGVRIADKHLEIVIRQMTSKGQILDVGNTGLFQGEFVNLDRIERINLGTYGQKAEYEPSVLGITQASLGAESFISAASFQETTRVLSRDTIVGKTDFLRGLKERVVLGDVIQAGTGLDDNINYGLLFGVTET